MSRSATIGPFFLGEGRFEFRLGLGELEQLEEGRVRAAARFGFPLGEASIERILLRLGDSQLILDEVRQVLRLGLIGAGMDKERALTLVERHVVPPDLKEQALLAYGVLSAALVAGDGEDQPGGGEGQGEPKGRRAKRSVSPTAERGGGSTTAKAPKRASRPRRSAP